MSEIEEKNNKAPEKAHCPTCNRSQNCNVHGRVYQPWQYSDRQGHSACGGITHTLFECRGCETVFYETSEWNDNDIDYWHDADGKEQRQANYTKETYPRPPIRPKPDWFEGIGNIDYPLYRILEETYRSYEQGCNVLTAIGLRTALDSCVTTVQIDPSITFSEKLKSLLHQGYIGQTEHDLLTVLTNAGNAAAHQGWAPKHEEINHLLDVLENFIQRVLVNGKRALAMKDDIPQRQRRKKTD